MTDFVDLRCLAESQPSVCIPRVFNNIDESRVRRVFAQLGLAVINRVDFIVKKNDKGESFKRVYVHFEKWLWTPGAQEARRKLITGKEIKIVYDDPWFWKVSALRVGTTNTQITHSAAPRIVYDEREDRHNNTIDQFGRNNAYRNKNGPLVRKNGPLVRKNGPLVRKNEPLVPKNE